MLTKTQGHGPSRKLGSWSCHHWLREPVLVRLTICFNPVPSFWTPPWLSGWYPASSSSSCFGSMTSGVCFSSPQGSISQIVFPWPYTQKVLTSVYPSLWSPPAENHCRLVLLHARGSPAFFSSLRHSWGNILSNGYILFPLDASTHLCLSPIIWLMEPYGLLKISSRQKHVWKEL